MDEDKIGRAMIGSNPEITIVLRGKKLELSDLLKMSASDLLKCQVTIKNHQVHFFEGRTPQAYFGPEKKGIGYQYRNVGACASIETGKETAIRLIDSVYGVSQCFRPDGSIII